MLSITTLLFPSNPELLIEEITSEEQTLIVAVRSSNNAVACPHCTQPAVKVHSRYTRTLADVPCMGAAVVLRVRVRRFFCPNAACCGKTFTEPLPHLAAAYARRTNRQADLLQAIAIALGGKPGASLSKTLKLSVSLHTLLRLLRRSAVPVAPTPRVLGVDDWSIRKGETYGSVLVDLERHHIVDVLPDREAETFAAWLKSHPGVEVIARDRAGNYAQGARKGAPHAVQVADRFHLLLNLQEALTRLFERKHTQLEQMAAQQRGEYHSADSPASSIPVEAAATSSHLTPTETHRQARQAKRQSHYETVKTLHEQGFSQVAIAAQVGLDRDTVRRYIRLSEIRAQGYRAGETIVYDYLRGLRERTQGRAVSQHSKHKSARTALSARAAAWLFLCNPHKLRLPQVVSLDQLRRADEA